MTYEERERALRSIAVNMLDLETKFGQLMKLRDAGETPYEERQNAASDMASTLLALRTARAEYNRLLNEIHP